MKLRLTIFHHCSHLDHWSRRSGRRCEGDGGHDDDDGEDDQDEEEEDVDDYDDGDGGAGDGDEVEIDNISSLFTSLSSPPRTAWRCCVDG